MTTEQIDTMSMAELADFATRQDVECRNAEKAAERQYGLTGEGRNYAAYRGWLATYAREVIRQRDVEVAIAANPGCEAAKDWNHALTRVILPAKKHAANQIMSIGLWGRW